MPYGLQDPRYQASVSLGLILVAYVVVVCNCFCCNLIAVARQQIDLILWLLGTLTGLQRPRSITEESVTSDWTTVH